MPDLTDRIAEVAAGPARVKVDGSEVEAPDIDKLCKADAYLRRATAADAADPLAGLRMRRASPPGAV